MLHKHRKKSQNIISFRGVFAPTGHTYKPLIEKKKKKGITWIPIYFYCRDGNFLPVIADGDFINSTLYSFTRAKECDTYLSRARDVDRHIRSRPGRAYGTP